MAVRMSLSLVQDPEPALRARVKMSPLRERTLSIIINYPARQEQEIVLSEVRLWEWKTGTGTEARNQHDQVLTVSISLIH